jgi:3-oxoacyl-[acyl-carrier protein] reductase
MIIVTGASRGLGEAICSRLLTNGKDVCGIARTKLDREYKTYQADVTDFEALKSVAETIRLSGIEVTAVINVAGIASMNLALMANPRTSENLMKVNFLGTVYSCQSFAPLLIRNKGGRILNFSTIATAINLEGESIYAATKAAVENYSKTLSKELSRFNINVNCIAPGPIQTDLLKGISSEQISSIVNSQVIQRQFEISDVADIVEILLDDRAKTITGQVIHVGGV